MSAQSTAIGALLGHYRIVELLGRGGMGVVFRAWDEQLERDVALKVLRVELDSNSEVKERFYREAKAGARLQHHSTYSLGGSARSEE